MTTRNRATLIGITIGGLLLALGACTEDLTVPSPGTAELTMKMGLEPAIDAGYSVTRVQVSLERGDFREEMDLTIEGSSAEGTFTGLIPGEYLIKVNVYEGDHLIATGTGLGVVVAGENSGANVNVDFLEGSLTVTVTWGSTDSVPALAHWKFTQSDDSILYDCSGNQHHGTISEAQWVPGLGGSAGTALEFNGSNSEVTVPTSTDFWGMKQLTVEAVFKVSELPNVGDGHAVVAVYDKFEGFNSNTQQPFRLVLDGFAEGTRLRFSVRTTGATAYDETEVYHLFEAFPVDTWLHIVGIFDDGDFQLYMNGELLETNHAYSTATIGGGETPLTIGYSIGTGNGNDDLETHLQGVIDEIRLTGAALDPSEFLAP